MPAPTTINTQRPHAPPKKTRVVRRRGRAHNGIYSDDEIEREARSDTSSDSEVSSLDSSDSETEPASEDVQPAALTPAPATKSKPLLAASVDWSEMVTSEGMHGAADLPVIDFADLTPAEIERTAPTHALQPQARPTRARSQKTNKTAKPPPRTSSAPPSAPSPSALAPELPQSERGGESPAPSSSHEHEHEHGPRRGAAPPRRSGQTARQAYQERLESDPSYVPTVGEFWGHDDRLLDKDLRSLSGWWRGRWQGRGAFRGRGFIPRGRGAFFARTSVQPVPGVEGGEAQEVRPSDREWTHDGFEEMKKRDERRNLVEQEGVPQRGGFRGGFRGARGGFVAGRGRGGFGRGGFSPAMATRTWFAMKPERVWTKHHELYLFSDPALKPRPGQGPGYRIKLPGADKEATVVHAPPRSWPPPVAPTKASTSAVVDDGEKVFTVRFPPRAGKEKAVEVESKNEEREPEQATTVDELSLDDAFTIKPPPPMIPIFPVSAPPAQATFAPSGPTSPPQTDQHQQATEPQQSPSADQAQGWIMNPPQQPEEPRPAPPVLPPLQTVFSPMAAPSPQFGSPYGFAPTPALPPGIVLNQHGMPYEMATGRAVYLQQPMYDVHPRGVFPPHMAMPPPPPPAPFVPQHLRHHSSMSVSPDFLAHPPTPPTFIETPIFTPPRQSSRIEIRKPTAESDGKKTASPRPSGLRSSVTSSAGADGAASSTSTTSDLSAVPRSANRAFTSPQQHAVPEFYPSMSPNYAVGSPEQGAQPPVDVQMMGYAQYPQQYYYPPEQYGYAPPPSAYDVPQPHHHVPYDMYAHPPHAADPRQPVYY